MFVLFDSRARSQTKRRKAYRAPETEQGLHDMWTIVLLAEVPINERSYYAGLADWLPPDEGEPFDPCEVFNDYWACYGWYLNSYEEDADCPDDTDMQN